MSAESQAALIASIRRFSAAMATADSLNSLRLEGRTLAEITTLILQGTAANADKLAGQTLDQITTTMTNNATGLVDEVRAALDAFIARRDNPHVVTKDQVGLGSVVNYPVATPAEATAGATDRYVTAALAQQIIGEAVTALVGGAGAGFDTLGELAGVLQNNPTIITDLQTAISDLQTQAGTTNTATQEALDGKLDVGAQAVDSAALGGRTLEQVIADAVAAANLPSKLDVGAQAADSALLAGRTVEDIIGQITGGSTETLLALRGALDTFIAGKATTIDTTTGTDDTRYVTSLSLRAETDRAIAALVDGAPTALDTLNELATRLTAEGDALAELITAVDAVAGRATALEGRATTAEGRLDGAEGRLTTAEGGLTDLTGRVTTAEGTLTTTVGRVDTAEGTLTTTVGRVDTAEGTITTHGTRLDAVEGRVTTAETRLDAVEAGGGASGDRLDALEPRVDAAEGNITALQTGKLDATAQAVDSALLEGRNRQSILDDAAASVTAGDFATRTEMQDMADSLTTSFEDATDSIEGFTRVRVALGVADLTGAYGFRAGTGGTAEPALFLGNAITEFSWAGTTGTLRITGDVTGTNFQDMIFDGLVSTGITAVLEAGTTVVTGTFGTLAGLPTTGDVRAAVRYTA